MAEKLNHGHAFLEYLQRLYRNKIKKLKHGHTYINKLNKEKVYRYTVCLRKGKREGGGIGRKQSLI